MYEYAAKVNRVVDGDTIDVDIDLGFDIIMKNQRVRMAGIDAPESRTRDKVEKKYGLLAKQYLVEEIEGQEVVIITELDAKGKYGRILAWVYNGETQKTNCINKSMVELGLAVSYHGQSKDEIRAAHILNRDPADKFESSRSIGAS